MIVFRKLPVIHSTDFQKFYFGSTGFTDLYHVLLVPQETKSNWLHIRRTCLSSHL